MILNINILLYDYIIAPVYILNGALHQNRKAESERNKSKSAYQLAVPNKIINMVLFRILESPRSQSVFKRRWTVRYIYIFIFLARGKLSQITLRHVMTVNLEKLQI